MSFYEVYNYTKTIEKNTLNSPKEFLDYFYSFGSYHMQKKCKLTIV